MNLTDYILKSADLDDMARILEDWAVAVRDLKYLLLNAAHLFGEGETGTNANTESVSNAPMLSRNKTLTQ